MRRTSFRRGPSAPSTTSKNFLGCVGAAVIAAVASPAYATEDPPAIASDLVSVETFELDVFDAMLSAASGDSTPAVLVLDGKLPPVTGESTTVLQADVASLSITGELTPEQSSSLLSFIQMGGQVTVFVGEDPLDRHILLIGGESDGEPEHETIFTPTSDDDEWFDLVMGWIETFFDDDPDDSGGGDDEW